MKAAAPGAFRAGFPGSLNVMSSGKGSRMSMRKSTHRESTGQGDFRGSSARMMLAGNGSNVGSAEGSVSGHNAGYGGAPPSSRTTISSTTPRTTISSTTPAAYNGMSAIAGVDENGGSTLMHRFMQAANTPTPGDNYAQSAASRPMSQPATNRRRSAPDIRLSVTPDGRSEAGGGVGRVEEQWGGSWAATDGLVGQRAGSAVAAPRGRQRSGSSPNVFMGMNGMGGGPSRGAAS